MAVSPQGVGPGAHAGRQLSIGNLEDVVKVHPSARSRTIKACADRYNASSTRRDYYGVSGKTGEKVCCLGRDGDLA